MNNLFEVVVVGGINCDIIGKSFEKIVPSTSNPGSINISPGGVGRNIAQNLCQLGIKTVMLGSVGKDSFGEGVYLAIISNEGEMELACKCGLAAAAITVSSMDTVSSELNEINLRKILSF